MSYIPSYDYCVIVLGLSGSGKSSLLCTLYNYLKGNSPGNFETEIEVFHGGDSGTQHVSFHTVWSYRYDFKKFLFIDTPGFNDTKGSETREEEIFYEIKNTLNKLKTINAVIYVHNSTIFKQNKSFKDATERILRLLNNDIKRVLISVLTYHREDEILQNDDEYVKIEKSRLLRNITGLQFEYERIFLIDNIFNHSKNLISRRINYYQPAWEKFCNSILNNIINTIKKKSIDNSRSDQIQSLETRISNIVNDIETKLKLIFEGKQNYVLKPSYNITYRCNDCHRNCIDDPGLLKKFVISIKKLFKRNCSYCYDSCYNHSSDYYRWEYEYCYQGQSLSAYSLKKTKEMTMDLYYQLKSELNYLQKIEPYYDIRTYISEISKYKYRKIKEMLDSIIYNYYFSLD